MDIPVIPLPRQAARAGGVFSLRGEIAVTGAPEPFNRAYLSDALTRTGLTVAETAERGIAFHTDGDLAPEAYALRVSPAQIHIAAGDRAGQFYAIATLMQLMHGRGELECVSICDAPRYPYRGFMLDVCRHFIPKEEVLRYIEIAALHKLNRLHLHLSDDQGWRAEIGRYPKLTQIGARRAGSLSRNYDARTSDYTNDGYFTQADIREIVAFAADRNMEVVPEIEIPGHFSAAAAAYPELLCRPHEVEVATKPAISREILCMGKDESYAFVYGVLDEIFALFPSRYVHLGGDEVFKAEWIACPHCLKTAKRNGLGTPHEMQAWFTKQVVSYAAAAGRTAILWNEAFMGEPPGNGAVCEHWNAMGKARELQSSLRASGAGIIDANRPAFYFDYNIGAISLKTAYEYESVFAQGYNLLGLEMALWTETVHSRGIANERLFPRMFALAESAWSPGEGKDYAGFRRRVLANAAFLANYGVTLLNQEKWEYAGLRSGAAFLWQVLRAFPKGLLRTMLEMNRINNMRIDT